MTVAYDPSTPREQNGFKLLEVALQQNTPALQGSSVQLEVELPYSPSPSFEAFAQTITHVYAQLPDGLAYPLGWSVESKKPGRIRIDLAPRYPVGTQYVDVYVVGKQVGQAHWRFNHLPATVATFPANEPDVTNYTTPDGVRMEARATYTPEGMLEMRSKGSAPYRPGTAWQFRLLVNEPEWMPAGYTKNHDKTEDMTTGVAPGPDGRLTFDNTTADQTRAMGRLRIHGEFRLMASQDEKVTFSNLKLHKLAPGQYTLDSDNDQTVVTPSGVRVTLRGIYTLPENAVNGAGASYAGRDSVRLLLAVTQPNPVPDAKSGEMNGVEVKAVAPWEELGSSVGQELMTKWLVVNKVPANLDRITIAVRNHAPLRVVPVTLVVPIQDGGSYR